MVKFKFRKIDECYLEVKLEVGCTTIDLGFLTMGQVIDLKVELEVATSDLHRRILPFMRQ